jgi:formamidopyrimidine-DNA glycosylase
MPELLEIEQYRRLAEHALGRTIVEVRAPDAWYLKAGLDATAVQAALVGQRFVAARRRGKLLLLDTRRGPTLGLRFGMTGRLILDGTAAIERLEYSSARDESGWDRFILVFRRGELRMRDPRRLGAVELDPDEEALGPDATMVTRTQLARLLQSAAPLKARLMDQRRLAGLGNLLTDEILWRASLDPAREARSLDAAETARLHRHLHRTLEVLGERGGSHTGDLQEQRFPGGACPRDGTPLLRRTVGGRTTYSCPKHQR